MLQRTRSARGGGGTTQSSCKISELTIQAVGYMLREQERALSNVLHYNVLAAAELKECNLKPEPKPKPKPTPKPKRYWVARE